MNISFRIHNSAYSYWLIVLLFYFQASPSSVAQHLNANDVDRIRLFMRDLVIKGVVPYAEKQLKQLNELVTNRKSRSLFSGAKRWFGTNKPNVVGGGTSVVYSKEAPELQVESPCVVSREKAPKLSNR